MGGTSLGIPPTGPPSRPTTRPLLRSPLTPRQSEIGLGGGTKDVYQAWCTACAGAARRRRGAHVTLHVTVVRKAIIMPKSRIREPGPLEVGEHGGVMAEVVALGGGVHRDEDLAIGVDNADRPVSTK